jgi:RNA polymerase sigma-70 factor (ECF subfamily)
MPVADSDAPSIERLRAGEPGAFDELVRKYEQQIRRMLRRYLPNEEDAKDVSQQAFVKAFEKLDSFRAESAFRTWLYRIAINLALNHTRGMPRGEVVPLDDVTAFTNSLGTTKLVAAELWRKVEVHLQQLPPKQRLVVELRLFHELSFAEVAIIAECSEDSAKVNYHHGVKRLRTVLPT